MRAVHRRTSLLLLGGLMLLAVGLRVGTIIYLYAWEKPGYAENRQIALNLLAGDGFAFREFGHFGPTSVVAPLYPALLAGLYALFGTAGDRADFAAFVLNLSAGAGAVFFAWRLCLPRPSRGTLTANRSSAAAAIAALLFAVWPTQVYAAALVQPLAIGVALTLLTLLLARRALAEPSAPAWAVCAATACVTALFDATLSVFALGLLAGGVVLAKSPPRAKATHALVVAVTLAALVGPWLYRNRLVHGRWTPIESTFAADLWRGQTSPESASYTLRHDLTGLPEAQRADVYWRLATDRIAADPSDYLRGVAGRVAQTLLVDWHRPGGVPWAYLAARGLLLVASAAGAGLLLRRRDAAGIMLLWLAFTIVAYQAVTVATPRATVYLEIAQLPLAARAFAYVWRRPALPLPSADGRGPGRGPAQK